VLCTARAFKAPPTCTLAVTRGEVEATVEFTGKNTFFGKTAQMLQGNDGLGNLQKILLRIMFVLVALSLTLCFIALMYLLFAKDQSFKEALSFTIVLLVASIPIAIEVRRSGCCCVALPGHHTSTASGVCCLSDYALLGRPCRSCAPPPWPSARASSARESAIDCCRSPQC
jgi:hypothetical protein